MNNYLFTNRVNCLKQKRKTHDYMQKKNLTLFRMMDSSETFEVKTLMTSRCFQEIRTVIDKIFGPTIHMLEF